MLPSETTRPLRLRANLEFTRLHPTSPFTQHVNSAGEAREQRVLAADRGAASHTHADRAFGLRRSSSTTMAPAVRASPLPRPSFCGQWQPRAFCISRRRVFAPTHPWLALIIPAKARRAMAATAAARAAAVAVFSLLNVVATQSLLHATCNLYCLSRGCTLARAIYLLGQISTRLSMLLASRRPCGRLDSDRGRRIESDAQPELRRVRRRRFEPS